MIRIDCPNCGPRNSLEFRFGGELNSRPKDTMAVEDAEWTHYIYMRANKLGHEIEWWYHRAGCGTWFLAERHTGTNNIIRTWLWRPQEIA